MLSVLVFCFCVYVALRPPWCLPTSAQRQRPLTEGSPMTLNAGEAVIENGWMGVSLLLYYLYLLNSYAPPPTKADGDICTKLLPLAVQLKCQVEKFKWLLCCSAAGLHPGGGGGGCWRWGQFPCGPGERESGGGWGGCRWPAYGGSRPL